MRTHQYHIVSYSPWPFFTAFSVFYLVIGLTAYMHFFLRGFSLLLMGLSLVVTFMAIWWRDIIREGFQGRQTPIVMRGLRMGMLLFIVSEIFFFLAFFGGFFHVSLSPSIVFGDVWPPYFFEARVFNAFEIPLLNTIILLSSGATVTLAHIALLAKERLLTIYAFFATLFLAFLFTLFQAIEYSAATFDITDSVYGSVFYLCTGFHGLHVIIGTIFLFVCLWRFRNFHLSPEVHFGFEAAAWYWHFVDVVWLFLFICIYFWGNKMYFAPLTPEDLLRLRQLHNSNRSFY
jgi:heme/copper-type cytochrome/quinol oxidase subunit 3